MAALDTEWHLTSAGTLAVTDNGNIKDKKEVLRLALNTDLKEICSPVLNKDISKDPSSKVVLQIQKIKNISAPKANEDSQAAPRMLKLSLTDGDGYIQAIEISHISSLSHKNTPPGTKILIQNAKYSSGYLLLSPESCTVLGGKVPHLVEKWELAKTTVHSQRRHSNEDGPPPWVHFGAVIKTNLQDENFASLSNKSKEAIKENPEFEQQRLEAIAEASTGAVKKVFGGRVKQSVQPVQNNQNRNKPKKDLLKGRRKQSDDDDCVMEKPSKPTNKVSLFSFLEDKLPVNETPQYTKNSTYEQQRQYSAPAYQSSNKQYNQRSSARQSVQNSYQTQEKYENTYLNGRQNDQNRKYDGAKQEPFVKFVHSENSRQVKQNNSKLHNSYERHADNNSIQGKQNISLNNCFEQSSKPYYDNSKEGVSNSNYQQNYQPQKQNPANPSKPKPFEDKDVHQPTQQNDSSSKLDLLNQNFSKISLNNNQFASRSLRQALNLTSPTSGFGRRNENCSQPDQSDHSWNVGDTCLAKYWEDGKYYEATIQAITDKTFAVIFKGYGNIEEILKSDCKRLPDNNRQNRPYYNQQKKYNNRPYAGSTEFRRSTRKYN